MKNRGQALIEFVIVLPIILILVFGIIDFARVVKEKNELESMSNDAVTLYKNGKSKEEIELILKDTTNKNVSVTSTETFEYVTLNLSETVSPITPGIHKILSSVFDISTTRVIYNE